MFSQGLAIILAFQDPVNQVAYGVTQGFAILVGIVTAQKWSQYTAKSAAEDLVDPHADASVRHLVTLGKSIATAQRRLAQEFELLAIDGWNSETSSKIAEAVARAAIDELKLSLAIADDAIASWRDVAPRTVEEIVDEPSGASGE